MRCAANERFVAIRGGRRIWTVGTIHGEAGRLAALHDALEERFEPGDRIVYLGNYLGFGSDVAAAIDELLAFRRAALAVPGMRLCDIVYLRGIQEEMWQKLLQIHLAVEPESTLRWMLDRGVRQTLEAYGGDADSALARARLSAQEIARWTNELRAGMERRPGHRDLLAALRRAAYTEDGALLFVNAGVDVSRPLDAQYDTFWWGGAALSRLASPYGEFKKVIRGFDPFHQGVRIDAHVATIDGGAGYGGGLVAACFDAEGGELDRIAV